MYKATGKVKNQELIKLSTSTIDSEDAHKYVKCDVKTVNIWEVKMQGC